MKKVNRLALITSKIMEVAHWIGVVSMTVLLIGSLAAKERIAALLNRFWPAGEAELTTYGFSVCVLRPDATVNRAAIVLFCVGSLVILSLYAMIFRNACLILKTARGDTWFSKGSTPFQSDVIRMLREIGIFFISAPVAGYLVGLIGKLILGVDAVEISVQFGSAVVGILMFCLTDFFAYGVQLQNDVDGLL